MGYPESIVDEKNPRDNLALSVLSDHMNSKPEKIKKLLNLKKTLYFFKMKIIWAFPD